DDFFLTLHSSLCQHFKLLTLFLFLLGTCLGDYGIGVGIGDGGVWVGGGGGGGGNHNSDPGNAAYRALQSWKSAITEDPSGLLKTWVGEDVCSYKGIFCSGSSVISIDLNKANLKGTIVKDLSLLSDLTILHLNTNRFSGQIPDSFTALDSLQELDLSNNMFSGYFPRVTLYIPNLIYLDLRFNNFTGSVPQNLFNKQ
ncbi:leucine-rich repeat extensin-like protein 4, partial [Raphanus sativus]|uniref:Cell wall hydroxyproline-rich glycoprotein n=1 Tax=Raphanus sativus TaxID=3726 RepID=A0A9W3D4V5_RAPSA